MATVQKALGSLNRIIVAVEFARAARVERNRLDWGMFGLAKPRQDLEHLETSCSAKRALSLPSPCRNGAMSSVAIR